MSKRNLVAYRGDTVEFPLTFKDENDDPIDITGWTIFFTLRAAVTDTTSDTGALITKTVTSHSNPTAGQSMVTLSASDTNELNNITYKYDFQYKTTGGVVKTFLSGDFKFTKDVTRRTS